MNPILSKFHHVDVYAGFDPTSVDPDQAGPLGENWGGQSTVFGGLIEKTRPRVIIEVGSWKGMSAITMAKECQRLGLNTAVICVDTWLGAAVHWKVEDWLLNSIRLKHGYPTLYQRFLANVINAGVQDMVVPLPVTSEIGSELLRHAGVTGDLIFIDADHEYSSVRRDLENYHRLLSKGGTLFGHDWQFGSVRNAVGDFCSERELCFSVLTDPEFWKIG